MVLEPPAQLLSRRGGAQEEPAATRKDILLFAAKKCQEVLAAASRSIQSSAEIEPAPAASWNSRGHVRARYVLLACVHALALKMIPSRASNSFGTRGGGGRSGAPASRDRATMRAPTPHPPSRSVRPPAS